MEGVNFGLKQQLETTVVNVENAWCVIKQNYYLREMKSVFNDGH